MSAGATAATLRERPILTELPVEHLFDMSVDLEPAQVIQTPVGMRMTYIVQSGRLEGPALAGELLPGGGDWVVVGTDLIGRIDVRATIRTDDGALIHYRTRGVISIPPGGLQRLDAGERLPFEETYVRTTPSFETSHEQYAWLNGVVALGYNEISKDHIDYRIYRVR
jgi:Protein of unknown function (DUF3237)